MKEPQEVIFEYFQRRLQPKRLTPAILSRLEKNDPTLTELRLGSLDLFKGLPTPISKPRFHQLTTDDLKMLVDAMIRGGNTHLKKLILNDTSLGDDDAQLLSQLTHIEHLDLSITDTVPQNRITDIGAKCLARMPNLKYLSLSGDHRPGGEGHRVGNEGFKALIQHPTIQRLYLDCKGYPISNEVALLTLNNERILAVTMDESMLDKDVSDKIFDHLEDNDAKYCNNFSLLKK